MRPMAGPPSAEELEFAGSRSGKEAPDGQGVNPAQRYRYVWLDEVLPEFLIFDPRSITNGGRVYGTAYSIEPDGGLVSYIAAFDRGVARAVQAGFANTGNQGGTVGGWVLTDMENFLGPAALFRDDETHLIPRLPGEIHSEVIRLNDRGVALVFSLDEDFNGSMALYENGTLTLLDFGPGVPVAFFLDLNNQGKGLCTQISQLKRKYPFDPNASQDATLQELAAVFHPQQGSLWALYAGNLQELLIEQGGRFVAKPGGSIQLNPAFVAFFNQAAGISRAFYPEGATEPRFVYTVTPQPIDTLSRLQLRLDGQLLSSGEGGGKPQQILWPNDGSGSFLYGAIGGGNVIEVVRYTGPWAAFRFFASASRVPDSGSGDYEWRPTTSGQPMVVNSKVVIVRYNLAHGSNLPILKSGYLSTLSCPPSVTR